MENEIIKVLFETIGGLLSVLTIVIGWIGNRIHGRLDSISQSLSAIEKDLRDDLASLDRRITRIESKAESQ